MVREGHRIITWISSNSCQLGIWCSALTALDIKEELDLYRLGRTGEGSHVTIHVGYRYSSVVALRLYMILSTNSIALSGHLTNSQITPESIFGESMPHFALWTFVGSIGIAYVSLREEILATLRKKQQPRKKPEGK